MSSVYDSLKGTLQRSKGNSLPVARLKGSDASSLDKEMEQLETIVAERLGRLRAAVKEGEAAVASESQHVEQVMESLRTEIAAQEAQLTAARGKEAASHKMEQTLNAKIHDLQNDLKKKDDAIESHGKEVTELKSKIDALGKQTTQLESTVQQAKAETAGETKRAQQLAESSNAKIATLEAQVRDKDAVVRAKESSFKSLEQRLTTKIQALESLVNNKEKVLTDQDNQIKDLQSQLETLTNGIKGMSSFFKQAEAFAAVGAQDVNAVLSAQEAKKEKAKPASTQVKSAPVTSSVPEPAREPMPPSFFNRVTEELAEINGPLASMIVHDHVTALGESMEKFPKTRATELIKVLSDEITDEKVKLGFRKRITDEL
jgi:chromosome segregation ATPase